jgi:hypothetical protein
VEGAVYMCIEVGGIIKCGNNAVCTKKLDWVSMITPFDWKPRVDQ